MAVPVCARFKRRAIASAFNRGQQLTVISVLALGLVLSGAVILVAALFLLRRLIGQLPAGPARKRWAVMALLVIVFLLGYLGYAFAFWRGHTSLADLIVPGVFFLGACFVWLTGVLMLQTAIDVGRISRLERESVTDPLTGLFNRRYLDRRLKVEISSAKRYGLPLALLMIDIDHFKDINDRHGHLIGDQVLVALGGLLTEELREQDVLARFGGEEFVVIAPHTSLPGAAGIAERLRMRVELHEFCQLGTAGASLAIRLSVSVGVALLGDAADNSQRLVQAADDNLYRAKQQGRNLVVCGPTGG